MKKSILISTIIGLNALCSPIFSQNNQGELGLPGDNFNLYAALSIFQESATLEEFEQKLNSDNTKVNNLDLNGDSKIDYIKVIDHKNGESHAIVLQDVISANEFQDVAVIEVERKNNNKVLIQIIGDEQLYGKNYIVEPASNGTPNPGYSGNSSNTYVTNNYYNREPHYVYDVTTWGIIRYIFAPTYYPYVSPWYWGYYPHYWNPWFPLFYYDYHMHWYNHYCYNHFAPTTIYRVEHVNRIYAPMRSSSPMVQSKNVRGDYRTTYSHDPASSRAPMSSNYRSNSRSSNAANNNNRTYNPAASTRNNTRPADANNNTRTYSNQNRNVNSGNFSRQNSRPAYNNAGSSSPRYSASPSPRSNSRPASSPAPRSSGGSSRSSSAKTGHSR